MLHYVPSALHAMSDGRENIRPACSVAGFIHRSATASGAISDRQGGQQPDRRRIGPAAPSFAPHSSGVIRPGPTRSVWNFPHFFPGLSAACNCFVSSPHRSVQEQELEPDKTERLVSGVAWRTSTNVVWLGS